MKKAVKWTLTDVDECRQELTVDQLEKSSLVDVDQAKASKSKSAVTVNIAKSTLKTQNFEK